MMLVQQNWLVPKHYTISKMTGKVYIAFDVSCVSQMLLWIGLDELEKKNVIDLSGLREV